MKGFTAVLAVAVLLSGCSSAPRNTSAPAESAQAIPVKVRRPNSVERAPYISASGTVDAATTAKLAFQIPGRVTRVYVDEGQAVKQGQLLATIDAADYSNAFDAAVAQANAARATELKAQTGARKQEIEQARIDWERSRDEYNRMRFLYERKSLAPNDFQKIEAAYKAAGERYELAKEGARMEDKEAATATYQAATAQVSEAKKRVSDTRLLAPFNGFVGMRRVDPGDTVAAGMPVFTVLDLNPAKVRVGIPEAEIGAVRQGAAATVILPALAERTRQGIVELIGVAADAASRTYSVRITVPNPDHVLRAGMVAQARIQGAGKIATLTLPGEAMLRDEHGVTFVFVYYPDRKRVYARRVQPGPPLGSEFEIQSGLTGSEQVVIAGQRDLREGSSVDVVGGQ